MKAPASARVRMTPPRQARRTSGSRADILADVAVEDRRGIEIVGRNVEKALYLACMQVDGQHPVRARLLRSGWLTKLSRRSACGTDFAVLPCIAEIGHHRRDPARRRAAQGSIMMSVTIRWSFAGYEVDCTTNTSSPRRFPESRRRSRRRRKRFTLALISGCRKGPRRFPRPAGDWNLPDSIFMARLPLVRLASRAGVLACAGPLRKGRKGHTRAQLLRFGPLPSRHGACDQLDDFRRGCPSGKPWACGPTACGLLRRAGCCPGRPCRFRARSDGSASSGSGP